MKFCAPATWEADRFVRNRLFMHKVEDDDGRLRVEVGAGRRPVLYGPLAGFVSCLGARRIGHFGEIRDAEGYVAVVFGWCTVDLGGAGDGAPLALEN
eukprot:14747706-Alexandrium_andersonii.AAC.1